MRPARQISRPISKRHAAATSWRCRIALAILCILCLLQATGFAAVAVVSNKTTGDVAFTVLRTDSPQLAAKKTEFKLQAGDLTVVPLNRGETATLAVDFGKLGKGSYEIQSDAAYYFGANPTGKIELGRIGLGDLPAADPAAKMPLPPAVGSKRSAEDEEAARTITVKILVDEEEVSRRAIWEHRLKDRVAAASDIIEHTCGMKLKVIATDTWQSDNSINDFDQEVTEFIHKVDPGEARIAIGFTSQFQIVKGRTHLGGTRGPLARHILLREWSQIVSEAERLELLVHEVGHFIGAVHSPEPDSVMRAVLGDRQARAKRFQIHFDPLNTLAMNYVAEEWQQHPPLRSALELSAPTRQRMHAVYEAIDQSLPTDPAAAQYIRILNRISGQPINLVTPPVPSP
jgi:hypothetical protein